MTERPYTDVAVIMRRERIDNRWQPWRWSLAEVVVARPAFGSEPRLLLIQDEREQRWLPRLSRRAVPRRCRGLPPEPHFARAVLVRDVAHGRRRRAPMPMPGPPRGVSLSYHDAGRWLDAQETVEQVPCRPKWWPGCGLCGRALPARAQAPQAPGQFPPLQDRFGNPASVSTEKDRGGGGGEAAMADGFLGRWSRRKQEVREGKPRTLKPPARTPARR
jgi:hypothetical protein